MERYQLIHRTFFSAKPFLHKYPIAIALTAVLSACGGGGGGSDGDSPAPGGSGSGTATVSAGTDLTVANNSSVQLQATTAHMQGTVTYLWAQLSGPAVVLSSTVTANPTFTAPTLTAGQQAVLVFELTATDSNGTAKTDTIQVTVSHSGTAYRVKRVTYDLDNNGTAEGERTFSYDSSGKVTAESYAYTDDGLADVQFTSFSIDAPTQNHSTSYSYDSAGRITLWATTYTTGREEDRYDYDTDNLVTQFTIDSFNGSGALTSSVYFALTNTAMKLTSWALHNVSPAMLIQSDDLTYNPDGTVASDLLKNSAGVGTELTNYTYTASGKIDLIHKTNPAPGSTYFSDNDSQYDSDDRRTARINTSSDATKNYSWNYHYDSAGLLTDWDIDLSSNSSVEATVHVEYEAGSCVDVFIWAPRAEPNFTLANSSIYAPGAGYALLPTCARP